MDPSYVWQRAQLQKEYRKGTHLCDPLARCMSWSKGSEIARPAFPLLDRPQGSCPSTVSMAWIVRCTPSRTSLLASPPTIGSAAAGHGFRYVDHHCMRQWGVLSIPSPPPPYFVPRSNDRFFGFRPIDPGEPVVRTTVPNGS